MSKSKFPSFPKIDCPPPMTWQCTRAGAFWRDQGRSCAKICSRQESMSQSDWLRRQKIAGVEMLVLNVSVRACQSVCLIEIRLLLFNLVNCGQSSLFILYADQCGLFFFCLAHKGHSRQIWLFSLMKSASRHRIMHGPCCHICQSKLQRRERRGGDDQAALWGPLIKGFIRCSRHGV